MLQSSDRKKVQDEVQELVEKIKKNARKAIKEGISDDLLIEKVINVTVKKFTPKSKMLLSSVCNILLEETLSSEKYNNPKNKAFLYEKDILSELNSSFVFDVPDKIDYQASKVDFDKLLISGAIVLIGGVVSVPANSVIPVSIAVILAAIMYFVLKKQRKNNKKIYEVICDYLDGVSAAILQWIDNIEQYYDKRINEIEKEMEANG